MVRKTKNSPEESEKQENTANPHEEAAQLLALQKAILEQLPYESDFDTFIDAVKKQCADPRLDLVDLMTIVPRRKLYGIGYLEGITYYYNKFVASIFLLYELHHASADDIHSLAYNKQDISMVAWVLEEMGSALEFIKPFLYRYGLERLWQGLEDNETGLTPYTRRRILSLSLEDPAHQSFITEKVQHIFEVGEEGRQVAEVLNLNTPQPLLEFMGIEIEKRTSQDGTLRLNIAMNMMPVSLEIRSGETYAIQGWPHKEKFPSLAYIFAMVDRMKEERTERFKKIKRSVRTRFGEGENYGFGTALQSLPEDHRILMYRFHGRHDGDDKGPAYFDIRRQGDEYVMAFFDGNTEVTHPIPVQLQIQSQNILYKVDSGSWNTLMEGNEEILFFHHATPQGYRPMNPDEPTNQAYTSPEAGSALGPTTFTEVGFAEAEEVLKRCGREDLREKNLQPTVKINTHGGTVYCSPLLRMKEDKRPTRVAYVEIGGRVVCRIIYQSNSHAIWRVLPTYDTTSIVVNEKVLREKGKRYLWEEKSDEAVQKDAVHLFYGKGRNESAINLPFAVQLALMTDTSPPTREEFTEDDLRTLICNTVEKWTETDSDDNPPAYDTKINKNPTPLQGTFKLGTKEEGFQLEKLDITKKDSPDFSRLLIRVKTNSSLYGTLYAEVYPSRNGRFLNMILRDQFNRAWTIPPEVVAGQLNSFGVLNAYTEIGELNMGASVYANETPQTQINLGLCQTGSYADAFAYFLSKTAFMKGYFKKSGTPQPVMHQTDFAR